MTARVLSDQCDSTGARVPLYGPEGFAGMRAAGRLAADTLDHVAPFVRPGVTTAELNRLCEEFMRAQGGVPATIGFHGYQHASCISVNHVVTHGIPSDKRLAEGDIVNIDVTPILDGWHGDASRMYAVGKVSRLSQRLVDAAYDAMMAGIGVIRPGATLGDVGAAILAVARRERFSVVEEFCGHGLGLEFHDAPR